MARTKRAVVEQDNRYERAVFPKVLVSVEKPFQCRLDGCRKSYNHASSLEKHKKLEHRVTQNGRTLTAEEYSLFVAKLTSSRRNKSVKRQDSRKQNLLEMHRKPLKCAPMKPSRSTVVAEKQPRKTWFESESDVESLSSGTSGSERDNSFDHSRGLPSSDGRKLSESRISTTGAVSIVEEDQSDDDSKRSSSPSSEDEQVSTATDMRAFTLSPSQPTDRNDTTEKAVDAASASSENQVKTSNTMQSQYQRSMLKGSDVVVETSCADHQLSCETSSIIEQTELTGGAQIANDCDIRNMLNELLNPSLLSPITDEIQQNSSNSLLCSGSQLNASSSASSAAPISMVGEISQNTSRVMSFGLQPMSILQLHEVVRCMPNSSAFEMATEIQRVLSLPNEKIELVRVMLSAILFSRAQAFNEVRRLLPTYGALETEVCGAVRRIADLIAEVDSRPRFQLFEL